MDTVLVIGCHLSGLGVIRALGAHSLRIIALSYEATDMGPASKYVSERHWIPHPTQNEKGFVEYLLANGARWNGALIFDCDDHVAVAVSRHKELLSSFYRVIAADWAELSLFINKSKTYELARECGVPYPATSTPRSMDEIVGIKDKIDYPCLLKPFQGHEFKSKFNRKVFKVFTSQELEETFRLCLESGIDVMVQEIIPGADSEIYKMQAYVNSKGETVGKFFYRKLRQNPPELGVGRVAVSTERNREVEELSAKILAQSGFRGMCNFEFKKDNRDAMLKLMEVNVRMSRINWLPTFCGINFPWIIYMDLVQGEQLAVSDYRKNVYIIDLIPDILNSIFRHRSERVGVLDYIRPYIAKDRTFTNFSLLDFKPFLKSLKSLPRVCVRFLKRRSISSSRFRSTLRPAAPNGAETDDAALKKCRRRIRKSGSE